MEGGDFVQKIMNSSSRMIDRVINIKSQSFNLIRLASLTWPGKFIGHGHEQLDNIKSQAFNLIRLASLTWPGKFIGHGHEQSQAVDSALEGFADETGDLPLHITRGGAGFYDGGSRVGEISHADADV